MTPEIQTFLLAMTPIGELRAALPAALTIYHLNWQLGFLISVIGNLIPIIFLLLFLEPLSNWLPQKSALFQKFFIWLFEKTRNRFDLKMKKYGYPGLMLFVAIPLPLTGGWTGAILAFLFKIPFKIAFPLIALGVIIAGVIVLILTQAGIAIEKYLGWHVLLGVIITTGIIYLIFKNAKK